MAEVFEWLSKFDESIIILEKQKKAKKKCSYLNE